MAEVDRLKGKILDLEMKLELLAKNLEPIVREYYARHQPLTPRGPVKMPVYVNQNTKETHGYYAVEVVYQASDEGIDEETLKEEVKLLLRKVNKNFNPSAFARALNNNIRSGSIVKKEGYYFYREIA